MARIINEDPESRPISNMFHFIYQAYQQDDLALRLRKEKYQLMALLERRRYDRILVGDIPSDVDLVGEDLTLDASVVFGPFRIGLGAKFYQYRIQNPGVFTTNTILGRVPKREFPARLSIKTPLGSLFVTQTIYMDVGGRSSSRTSASVTL